MFRKHFEYIFVVDRRDAAVREIETEHIDYAGGVVLDHKCIGTGVPGHY